MYYRLQQAKAPHWRLPQIYHTYKQSVSEHLQSAPAGPITGDIPNCCVPARISQRVQFQGERNTWRYTRISSCIWCCSAHRWCWILQVLFSNNVWQKTGCAKFEQLSTSANHNDLTSFFKTTSFLKGKKTEAQYFPYTLSTVLDDVIQQTRGMRERSSYGIYNSSKWIYYPLALCIRYSTFIFTF